MTIAVDLPGQILKLPMFADLAPDKIEQLLSVGVLREVPDGETFVREGEPGVEAYVILGGEVEVYKTAVTYGQENEHILARIVAPNLIGEFTLFDFEPRSSSVRAVGPVKVLELNIEVLRNPEYSELYSELLRVCGGHIVQRLRVTNDVTVHAMEERLEESKARISLGVFFVYIISALAVYTMCLRSVDIIKPYVPGGSRSITVIVLIVIAAVCILAIRKTPYPARTYGLTFDNWWPATKDAVLWSLPAVAAITPAKYLALQYVLGTPEVPLFDPLKPFSKTGTFNLSFFMIALVFYVLASPLQELVVRGSLQSCLEKFLNGSPTRVMWISILTSNLIFAMAHSHLRLSFALAAFVPGLLWGWLYSRHGTLVAPCVSHIMVGVYTLFVIGTGGLI
ncbi:MAG: CPBP family intramembrane metalloprotease [Alphaproteobacteria bacterium]|nr:CPBP family intramembrane metalloprotease [Alphaproteobacteria bacterium]